MANGKGNYCKTKITFTCETYDQTKCRFFEQHKDIPTTACTFGLYERPCSCLYANEQSLLDALKKRRHYEKERQD